MNINFTLYLKSDIGSVSYSNNKKVISVNFSQNKVWQVVLLFMGLILCFQNISILLHAFNKVRLNCSCICLELCLPLEDLLSSHCLHVAGGSSRAPDGAAEPSEEAGGLP